MFILIRQLRSIALCFACFFSVSHSSFAAESTVAIPASFGESRATFIEKLRFPNHDNAPAILIKCGVSVQFGGVMSGAVCFSNEDHVIETRMRQLIVRASKTTRIKPATIDGKEHIVWFNFSIIYSQENGIKSIEILENQLLDIESLGPHYVAAQRSHSKQDLFCFDWRELPISILARISAEGQVTDITLSKDPKNNQCADEIEKLVRKSIFIPATAEGNAVASTYNEVFHHYIYDPF